MKTSTLPIYTAPSGPEPTPFYNPSIQISHRLWHRACSIWRLCHLADNTEHSLRKQWMLHSNSLVEAHRLSPVRWSQLHSAERPVHTVAANCNPLTQYSTVSVICVSRCNDNINQRHWLNTGNVPLHVLPDVTAHASVWDSILYILFKYFRPAV
jgi:hypothetical protein